MNGSSIKCEVGPNPGHTLAVWNLEAVGKGSSWEEPLAE